MNNIEEIIKNLPSSWKELKLKDYLKIVDVSLIEYTNDIYGADFVKLDNAIRILSSLTGLTVDEIEKLPMSYVNQMVAKISFMDKLPSERIKPPFKIKRIEQITFEEYISFLNYTHKPELIFSNLPNIIRQFSITPFTQEEVENLNMEDVLSCFFLSKKQLMTSLNNSIRQTVMRLIKLKMIEVKEHLLKKFKIKKQQSTSNTDSTF
ncbi:hypothetical protein U0033_26525 [Chitinophaga sancti]|uniref:Uncharacterized protein n=2 Tax=Chitinophaga sancti TaxID=1004 RepID=A0ABZ0XPP2_9BACT|nr:hypothetical protein [Chitinophaga sancti]WQD61436.1 hypothetical protein U0033_26525 [Chitinophaga sancti]WQG92663.1 hypothetical protein SR876_14185 [Chitinophaga sancti]WQG93011.1 hypothetical protein SR876_15935 [Chitinophaga sancti]